MARTRKYAIVLSVAAMGVTLMLPGCGSGNIPAIESARRQFGDTVRLEAASAVPGARDRRESVHAAYGSSGLEGYVATVWCKSKSNLFPVRVVIDRSFRVLSATVLSYPSRRGRKVQSPRFTRQFTGKGPRDPVVVGKDIDAVSGATSSSSAMARGVRRAIRSARRSRTVTKHKCSRRKADKT
ncbi:MAG: FMN-binding protein [Phycisphaerae bacterium]|jgi:uncharacterized protein with FMN-binding domain|nr:FMN-binding protein [Phycisphaerae bacterium]